MTTDDFIRDLLTLGAMLTQGDPFSAGDLLFIGEYTLSDGSGWRHG